MRITRISKKKKSFTRKEKEKEKENQNVSQAFRNSPLNTINFVFALHTSNINI